ncbi:MAG: arginine--tRNA ligase [Rhodospirillaceae bacterium]|jgi:arginyl-tRNA synthetase|nr:arginine--tRNA ligase [Rhodospirillaceae bacterium]MBT4219027.1 arginine--tRNA ligase [Rhodospirillaceae bacterium]MBT4464635.1 arginine--tRNA ligase [Rhodospirillaceae bacterium]MBT5013867.1 arginine--tRNA ligase [Rhodospirillaceae bacterium]MBT5309869.1 arginine--tRNA ligase [Rhodospirillaceae bacterium]
MNLFEHFRNRVIDNVSGLVADGVLPEGIETARINVEPPREAGHGDLTTNAAMLLAKPAGMKPRDLAEKLVEKLLGEDNIVSADVAGPGFINMTLDDGFWHQQLSEILAVGTSYGDSTIGGGETINVEFVSANPTGPMHVGHGRGAVVGDVLANMLTKAGFDVTREYYINDAGAQVDVLARSLHLRYRQALGDDIGEIPDGLYPGEYLITTGQRLAEIEGDKWKNAPEDDWMQPVRDFAINAMMDIIRIDLKALGITHDRFTSERELVASGAVADAIADLEGRGLIYQGTLEPPKGKLPDDWEEREQTLFKSSDYGDDSDRPVKKSDGSWTYFATDMAYHREKQQRGFNTMIDVWGVDHGGYVKRVSAAVKALTDGAGELDVKLCNLVNLMEDGKPVKMSKRAGTFVTLRDVIDKVGKDVVRFIMLTRKNDMGLDFDLAGVMEQSRDNPVFYVQYAHARIHSVLRHAAEDLSADALSDAALAAAPLDRLNDPVELALIKRMANWPRIVESAAEAHEPHRIVYYLGELAAEFHGLWNKGKDDASLRFILADDPDLTRARLALVKGAAFVIASGLEVIGVVPVEEMR